MMRKLIQCSFLAVTMLTTAAMAAEASSGLGARWPSVQDVSAHPAFHAYRWVRSGVTYVQVNAQDGTPKAAIAFAGADVLILPVGAPDSVQVVDGSSPTSGSPIYQDDQVEITQDDESGALQVKQVKAAAAAAPCDNPVNCGKPQVQ